MPIAKEKRTGLVIHHAGQAFSRGFALQPSAEEY
jgi:hypothetical protein